MTNDRAGHMPNVNVQLTGKDYTPDDKRMVQGAIFYLQEVIKLFPAGAHLSLVATWEHGGDKRETVNLGTLSNMEIIVLLAEVEKMRVLQEGGVAGNA